MRFIIQSYSINLLQGTSRQSDRNKLMNKDTEKVGIFNYYNVCGNFLFFIYLLHRVGKLPVNNCSSRCSYLLILCHSESQ